MQIEIDQSGKIEDTSKDTVLALSNGTQFSIKIPRKIKRELQVIFRKNKQPRNFVMNQINQSSIFMSFVKQNEAKYSNY